MSSTVARAPAPLLPPLGRSESEDGVESLEVDGGQARAALAAITADEKANPFFGGSLSRMFGPKSPKSPADLHEAKPTAPFPRRAVSLDSALTPDAETENKPRQDVGFFGRLAPKGRRTPSECEKMVASSHLASSEASTEPACERRPQPGGFFSRFSGSSRTSSGRLHDDDDDEPGCGGGLSSDLLAIGAAIEANQAETAALQAALHGKQRELQALLDKQRELIKAQALNDEARAEREAKASGGAVGGAAAEQTPESPPGLAQPVAVPVS